MAETGDRVGLFPVHQTSEIMNNNYKWSSPHDWLIAKVQRHNDNNEVSEMQSLLQTLIYELDADKIQDLFQSDMDADGYFDPESEEEDTEEE